MVCHGGDGFKPALFLWNTTLILKRLRRSRWSLTGLSLLFLLFSCGERSKIGHIDDIYIYTHTDVVLVFWKEFVCIAV